MNTINNYALNNLQNTRKLMKGLTGGVTHAETLSKTLEQPEAPYSPQVDPIALQKALDEVNGVKKATRKSNTHGNLLADF